MLLLKAEVTAGRGTSWSPQSPQGGCQGTVTRGSVNIAGAVIPSDLTRWSSPGLHPSEDMGTEFGLQRLRDAACVISSVVSVIKINSSTNTMMN